MSSIREMMTSRSRRHASRKAERPRSKTLTRAEVRDAIDADLQEHIELEEHARDLRAIIEKCDEQARCLAAERVSLAAERAAYVEELAILEAEITDDREFFEHNLAPSKTQAYRNDTKFTIIISDDEPVPTPHPGASIFRIVGS